MRSKIFFLLTFIFSTLASFAQGYYMRGRVIDAKTTEPIPFATVALLDAQNVAVYGTLTDDNGKFEFLNVKENEYTISVSFVGYKEYANKVTPVMLKREGGAKLSIRMREDISLLTEYEVVGTRTNLQMDVDKKTFVVSESAMTAGVSATDLLRDIPTVDVDLDGNVSLRNNENVEVFINGKSAGLSSETQGDLLEQFPAGSIEKVEIITNPSSKYSAEGSAGIINIVLKKDAKPGVFGTISAGVSYPWEGKVGGNVGAGLTVTKGKWTYIASLGWQRKTFHGTSDIKRENYKDEDTTFIYTDGFRDFRINSFFGRLSADCQINDNNRIGVSGLLSLGKNNRTEDLNYQYGNIFGSVYEKNLLSHRLGDGESPRNMFNLKLDYGHNFSKTADILFQAQYSQNNTDNSTDFIQEYYDYLTGQELVDRYSQQIQDNERTRSNTLLSVDYTKAVGQLSKLELGLNANLQTESNDVVYRQKLGGASDYEIHPGLTSDFTLYQNIYAFYGMWSQTYKRFSYKAGLRGELSDVSWKQKSTNSKDNIEPYTNLFPSLFVSYKFSDRDELQFSGLKRISRPRGFRLNPNPNMSDSSNISYGNPDLMPERTTSLEMNYLHTTPKDHVYTASIYYRFTDDVVEQYSWIDGNAFKSTYANLNKSHSAGLELIAKNKFKPVTFTTNFNLYNYNLVGGVDSAAVLMDDGRVEVMYFELRERHGFTWNAKESVDIRLPYDISGQFSLNYRSPRVAAQGTTKQEFVMNIGFKRPFFDRKLNLSLSVRDITNSRNRDVVTYGEQFHQRSISKRNSRTLAFTATYNFGTGNKDKKGKKGKDSDSSRDDDMMMDDFD